MRTLRPLIVFGTRPEAIKLAPVIRECARRSSEIEPLVCSTGQHREMLEQATAYFGIRPDVDLQLMRPNQTLAELTAACLAELDAVLVRHEPDAVVAQGDTTTTFTAALAAFYRRVPFVHVEAGLRTGDLRAPWPEEFNRRATSLVAALHCAPTSRAAAQLLAEGARTDAVRVTGNTVIDALLWTLARERERDAHWRARYDFLGDRRLVLVTGHRRESFGAPLEAACRALASLARRFADVEFLYPVHLNPRVQEPVQRLLGGLPNVRLTPPVAYSEFVWLMDRSHLVVTDSGGVQEEAPTLRKPVVVLRETTERPEAVEAGAAMLTGCDPVQIETAVAALLTDEQEYRRRQVNTNPYGDGHAAERIVDWMLERLRASA